MWYIKPEFSLVLTNIILQGWNYVTFTMLSCKKWRKKIPLSSILLRGVLVLLLGSNFVRFLFSSTEKMKQPLKKVSCGNFTAHKNLCAIHYLRIKFCFLLTKLLFLCLSPQRKLLTVFFLNFIFFQTILIQLGWWIKTCCFLLKPFFSVM